MKHLSYIFLLAIIFSLVAVNSNAYDFEVDGIYYTKLTANSVSVSPNPNGKYYGTIVIPESITYEGVSYDVVSIGSKAFYQCYEVTSILIPESVTEIGTYAFRYCSGLTSINIPSSITNLGELALSGCDGLTSINISEGVKGIGPYALSGCSSLTTIDLPESIETIGEFAFSGCSGLTSIYIHDGIKSIGQGIFSGCNSLASISVAPDNKVYDSRDNCNAIIESSSNTLIAGTAYSSIPASVTSIGKYAFTESGNLVQITIPGNVTNIGNSAFFACEKLKAVTLSEGVESIGAGAFARCSLLEVNIPASVTSIGREAFGRCTNLSSINVDPQNSYYNSKNNCNAIIETNSNTLIAGCQNTTIPEDVEVIGDDAFCGCSNLTSIIIPKSVTRIGSYAFAWAFGLKTITIPESVTEIGFYAFFGCSNLATVIVRNVRPIQLLEKIYNSSKATLYVPIGCKEIYESANYWQEFSTILEMKDDVIINSTGYATYCSSHDLDFSAVSDIKAYIASGFNPSTGELVLTRVSEVPAGEGLYLTGEEGSYEVPFTETKMMYSNFLRGVTEVTTLSPTDSEYTNYILAEGSHGVGFYTLSGTSELAAGKAYLQLPTSNVSNVKTISLIFNDDETGILETTKNCIDSDVFSLQGIRIKRPCKGLYIMNGKKILINN